MGRREASLDSLFRFPVAQCPSAGYRKLMIASMSGTHRSLDNQTPLFAPALPPRAEMERAFFDSDASYDGIFVTGVRTTGSSAGRPAGRASHGLENIEFFGTCREALFAGYRPCLRCRPLVGDATPDWLAPLLDAVDKRSEPPAARQRPARVRRRSGPRAAVLPRALRHDLPCLLPRPPARRRASSSFARATRSTMSRSEPAGSRTAASAMRSRGRSACRPGACETAGLRRLRRPSTRRSGR